MVDIRIDDLTGSAIKALLEEHLRGVAVHSPPDSRHALDLKALRKPEITFWTAWENGGLLGCAALRKLDETHVELKSMKTATPHLRRGVGTKLLRHLLEAARERGYQRISLETGSMVGFAPARQLYARFGFAYCGPFGSYVEDPNSVFMTRIL